MVIARIVNGPLCESEHCSIDGICMNCWGEIENNSDMNGVWWSNMTNKEKEKLTDVLKIVNTLPYGKERLLASSIILELLGKVN